MESLLLSCRALSSPTTCRFIPALSELPTNVPRSATVGLGQVTITSTGLDDVRCYSSSRGFSSTHMTCPVLPPDLPK